MLLNEIFRNHQLADNDNDNTKCDVCMANFTVPFVAAKLNQALACPNCGSSQNARESIANKENDDNPMKDVSMGDQPRRRLRGR